ncbi:MAG: translation initiation factor IF-2 subunit gamma [Nitrososphaerota archaeon]|nr:translation initiation factor IF-2 subunit gamma [Nitrososphaerota archaeon]
MSEQKFVEPSGSTSLLPKQPEVNIGTSGHVDHGKCLTIDQYVLVNGDLLTGRELLGVLKDEGVLLSNADGGSTYRVSQSKVVSLDRALLLTRSDSLVYVQDYAGLVYAIKTTTGRSVTVTPEHPLLVNRSGRLLWVPAKDISREDRIAFARTVPLDESLWFPDAKTALSRSYEIVTWEQSERLRKATRGFTDFVALDGSDFELLRLMAGVTRTELADSIKVDQASLTRALSGRQTVPSLRRLLARFFAAVAIEPLSLDGLILAQKEQYRGAVCRIHEPQFDDDLVKWFALIFAQGHVREDLIEIGQTIRLGMLEEVLAVTERKFGLRFRKVGESCYRLHSQAFVDYLTARYAVEPGNKRLADIPGWLLKLPRRQKALFLRWFLTLEGGFDDKTGRISTSEVSARNATLLGYLLGSFGMVPRFSMKDAPTARGAVEHRVVSISGWKDLETFSRLIGFEDCKVEHRLSNYLRRDDRESKGSDLSIPLDPFSLRSLLVRLGVIREGFGARAGPQAMARTEWRKAYECAKRSKRVSRERLTCILNIADAQILRLGLARQKTRPTRESLLESMSLARLSQEEAAVRLGYSRNALARRLRSEDGETMRELQAEVRTRIREVLATSVPEVNELRRLVNAPLEFDKIKSIRVEQYSGKIFDLSVPAHGNFLGGVGAIVCHNTTLTQALTGVWASAHSEELKRGITIKVGYADAAFYRCPNDHGAASYSTSTICPICGKKTAFLRAISFVDCPGHESLMTNMLAGAFLMDGALLVVAANEPVPKPQTREHLQALQMLGMKKIVIAQNKVDLVTDAEAEKNHSQIRKFVEGTVAEGAPIIPISAQQRLNIDALIEALENVVPTPERDAGANPLMYVLRSFDVNKPGAALQSLSGGVLGGSLTRGELKVGDEMELRPGMVDERSGKYVAVTTRVSSLQTSAGPAERVGPGGLIAVGTHLDPTFVKGDQMVGSVIGKPGTLPETLEHITLDVSLLETAVGAAELVKVEKVRLSETVRLNLGTASTLAVATSVRGDLVELDLKKPVSVESGMRAAISRRIAERWRLIGSGVLK